MSCLVSAPESAPSSCQVRLTHISGSHPFVIAALLIFATFFPLFIWVESRVAKPIMPLYLIRHPPRANLIFANFIAALLSNSILFNM